MSKVAHSVKSSLLVAFRYLLKPLVRMALKNGVLFSDFSSALKRTYIDVASRQIKAAGTTTTSEGIFVITGIEVTQVEEVLRAETLPDGESLSAQYQSPLPRILSAWHTDSRSTGPYGVLRDLPYSRDANHDLSFCDLAATYCPEVSPRPLLDELIRSGCVKDVGNGFYRALERTYVTEPLSDDSIRQVAHAVHNLCETLEFNLRQKAGGRSTLLQRTVFSDTSVSVNAMPQLVGFVRERGQLFAEQIDDWFVNNQEPDASTGIKTGVGIYHYVANLEEDFEFFEKLPVEGDKK